MNKRIRKKKRKQALERFRRAVAEHGSVIWNGVTGDVSGLAAWLPREPPLARDTLTFTLEPGVERYDVIRVVGESPPLPLTERFIEFAERWKWSHMTYLLADVLAVLVEAHCVLVAMCGHADCAESMELSQHCALVRADREPGFMETLLAYEKQRRAQTALERVMLRETERAVEELSESIAIDMYGNPGPRRAMSYEVT